MQFKNCKNQKWPDAKLINFMIDQDILDTDAYSYWFLIVNCGWSVYIYGPAIDKPDIYTIVS